MSRHISTPWYNYTVVDISEDGDIGYKAIIPKFPNVYIVADSPEELHEVVCIMIDETIEDYKKEGRPIPEPDNAPVKYSGKFTFRTKPEIHQRLAELAQAENSSVNKYVEKIVKEKVFS